MSKRMNLDMQERALKSLVDNSGFQFTNTFFPYTSGQIGPYFVQSADVMKNGESFRKAIEDMSTATSYLDSNNVDDLIISGGETRDWIFSNPVGSELCLPTVMLYKDGKTVGADMKDKKVFHIADLNNEGSSPRDYWIPIIRKAGGKIDKILFYVDRMEDGVEEMRKLGLESYAIAPLNAHAWNFLQYLPGSRVTPEIHTSLRERLENKENWARRMLKSDIGLARYNELLTNPKTTEKALKIVRVGYPDMRDELSDRLLKVGVRLSDYEGKK